MERPNSGPCALKDAPTIHRALTSPIPWRALRTSDPGTWTLDPHLWTLDPDSKMQAQSLVFPGKRMYSR